MTDVSGMKYHFIGIGGIGTSGLAKMLINNGAAVSGSDMDESAVVSNLHSLGAVVAIGHRPENISPDTDEVVISAAITAANPELARASELGLPIYKYAEMLGRLMDSYSGIAVAGTHGKSTTSGWLSYVFARAGAEPNYIVGAYIPQLNGSSGVGNGDSFVAEACEYDRSFLNLRPSAAVLLNVEQDHLDYYRDEDEIVEAFGDFAAGAWDGGIVIANGQDKNVTRVIRRLGSEANIVTYGLEPHCDFAAKNLALVDGSYEFDIYHKDALLGRTGIALPGEFNVLNALAVTAACVHAGLDAETILKHLGGFTGIDRRLMLKAQIDGITVLDDYAHHPTEIRASLKAIREKYAPERIWCVFQPHQYSRTRFLLDDFAESFKLADITIVPEIYFVRDTAESKNKVNAETLVERIRQRDCEALFINEFSGICEYLKANVKTGDLVVTMGAGTIWKVADEYIQWFRNNR
ncbi:MAG: UDP-N-acetylmuramate--L-alanine ligase [Planctomycetota bacterium]|jgi:UDP-N-acetylmuramate--alanine ligase